MPDPIYRAVEPVLLQLEQERKRQARLAFPFLVFAVAGGLLALIAFADILFLFWLKDDRSVILFAAGIVLGLAAIYRYGGVEQKYRRRSRRDLLARILEELGCSVREECGATLAAEDLHATRILAEFDRAKTDCLAEAVHGKTPMQVFYVHTEYIYDSSLSKGRRINKYRTRFKGIVLLGHPIQYFPLTLVVEPAEKGSGSLPRVVHLNRQSDLEYLEPQSEALRERIAIYADHPDLARRLLPPALLKELSALQEAIGLPVSFSYIGSALCLAVGSREEDHQLDLGLTQSLLNAENIIHLAEELKFGVNVIKAFEASPTI